MTRLKDFKSKIITDINNKNLSEVLPSVIDFAEETKNTELRQLCIDELYGYETNVELPEYRNIPVDFYDKYGDKITRYSKGSIISISEVMQKAFSPNNPILEVSENKDLQLGIMWLFSGAVMTFRNVNAHSLNPNMTKNECIEQLNFLSYLHRVLEETILQQ